MPYFTTGLVEGAQRAFADRVWQIFPGSYLTGKRRNVQQTKEILDSEDLRLLADIGFIALSRGLAGHAGAIFDAIKALRPEQEAGFLGHGMIDILSGTPATAVDRLKEAPQTDGVLTFLGIAHIQSGNASEGKALLEEVCKTAADTPFAKIAEETLGTLTTA